jgi:uncharacterized protein YceH (UPF0502 family)
MPAAAETSDASLEARVSVLEARVAELSAALALLAPETHPRDHAENQDN